MYELNAYSLVLNGKNTFFLYFIAFIHFVCWNKMKLDTHAQGHLTFDFLVLK